MVVPVPVREVMVHDVVTVTPDTPMPDAIERFRTNDIGSVVVASDDTVVGILTDSDLVDLLASGADVAERSVADCMTAPARTTTASASIVEVARDLRDAGIDQVPVLADDQLAGLVSVTDLSAYLPQSALKSVEAHPVDREGWEYEFEGADTDADSPDLAVGDTARFSKTVSAADVEAFSRASGDENPIHLDAAFAERTRFGRRIVHGMLAASLFSAALARLPGLVIYLSQDVRFLAPVDIGERVSVECEVIQDLGHGRYRLATTGEDESGEEVLVGEAVVLVDPLPTPEDTPEESAAA